MKGVIWVLTDPQVAESFCEKTLSAGLVTNLLQQEEVSFLQTCTERGHSPTLFLTNRWNTTFEIVHGGKQSKIDCMIIREISHNLMPFTRTTIDTKCVINYALRMGDREKRIGIYLEDSNRSVNSVTKHGANNGEKIHVSQKKAALWEK